MQNFLNITKLLTGNLKSMGKMFFCLCYYKVSWNVFTLPNRALPSSSSSAPSSYYTAFASGNSALSRIRASTTIFYPDTTLPPSDTRSAASLQQRGMQPFTVSLKIHIHISITHIFMFTTDVIFCFKHLITIFLCNVFLKKTSHFFPTVKD